MQKINFEDLPSTNTPINASNLNLLQTNIEDTIFVTTPSLTALDFTDLNDVVVPKIYIGYGSYANSPVPNNTTFKLEVVTTKPIADSNTWIFQTLTMLNGKKIYQRGKLNAQDWYPWVEISANADITTGTEFETGRIIDGHKEYGIIINTGNLPNASTQTISFSASGKANIRYEGTATAGTYVYMMIPFKGESNSSIVLQYSTNNFTITTYNSSYTNYTGRIYVYYTKT